MYFVVLGTWHWFVRGGGHENQMLAAVGLLWSTGFFLAASVIAALGKSTLKPKAFAVLAWPGIVILTVLFAFTIASVAYDLAHR